MSAARPTEASDALVAPSPGPPDDSAERATDAERALSTALLELTRRGRHASRALEAGGRGAKVVVVVVAVGIVALVAYAATRSRRPRRHGTLGTIALTLLDGAVRRALFGAAVTVGARIARSVVVPLILARIASSVGAADRPRTGRRPRADRRQSTRPSPRSRAVSGPD